MNWFDRIYVLFIAAFAATVIWAAFDVHNRIAFVMFAQAPVLLLRVFWKARNRRRKY